MFLDCQFWLSSRRLGRLYELDGLKEVRLSKRCCLVSKNLFRQGPIDHGVIPDGVEWTDVARPIVQQRMQK